MATHSISMQGIGAQCLTAKKGAAATAGYPCQFSANDTVADAANNGSFSGVVAGVRGDLVTVLIVNVDTTAKTVCVLL